MEVVFVDLAQVYPNRENPMSEEYSFEELRARYRGWMSRDWAAIRKQERDQMKEDARLAARTKEQKPKLPSPVPQEESPVVAKEDVQPMIFRDPVEEQVPRRKKETLVFNDIAPDTSDQVALAASQSPEEVPNGKSSSMVFRDPVVPETEPSSLPVFRDVVQETPLPKAASPMVFRDPTDEAPKPESLPVFRDAIEEAPVPKASSSMVFRDPVDEAPKPKTVPLKGSVDDEGPNDENTPPSQADIEKAKAARRARREERANRTRKIKVMDVKEIRGETQTSECSRIRVILSLIHLT